MDDDVLSSAARFGLSDALFVSAIAIRRAACDRSILVGLAGPQGSGKTTTAKRLKSRLDAQGLPCAICSLDDFYLTVAERNALSETVHPLLGVRGVPGTHDMALMGSTIEALLHANETSVTSLPVFDKASDDRMPANEWRLHHGRAEVVLLEGWCIGARAMCEDALMPPINRLERDEDPNGHWRRWVNARLGSDYADLFARIDLRLMLAAPSFDVVHRWRTEQEEGLPREVPGARAPMDAQELARFIAHYERITRQLLAEEPADIIASLDDERVPWNWRMPM